MNPTFADELASAVASVLAPDTWRNFDERTLAQRVVGAIDTHAVTGPDSTVPGAEAGNLDVVDAGPDDERVAVLARVLAGWNWRGFTREQLCRHLLASLQVLHADGMSSHVNVRWLLDGH